MIPSLIEAALRSVLVAIGVWTGLRVFRVSNVLAQKAAWGLVLASAIFMPMLLPVAAYLPTRAALVLPPDPETLLGKIREQMRPGSVPQPADQSVHQPLAPTGPSPAVSSPAVSSPSGPSTADAEDLAPQPADAPLIAARTEAESAPVPPSASTRLRTLPWRSLTFPLYAAIAIVIVFRLVIGLALAFRIRLAARPVSLTGAHASGLRISSSSAVSSPVTIGSSIILPSDYESWDTEKLHIVLAHERSHIRQGDFYLQLLAGLYTALFWFSPLGWWLKHKLSDLAEAISDHAGLQQAASRSSYAQILLEFAAAPRPTLIGVAMARTGSISRRIERLLNDSTFRQAFAGTRRRALIAVLLVPVALFAATALVRVQAASQAPGNVPDQAPAQPAKPSQPEAPLSGISTPEQPSNAAAPSAIQAPSSEVEPQPAVPQVAPAPPGSASAPAPGVPRVVVVPKIAPKVVVIPPMPRIEVHIPQIDYSQIRAKVEAATAAAQAAAREGHHYSYAYSSNGDSYGIVRGNGEHAQFSGDLHNPDVDKIRKLAHGDFLWFKRDGKYYYVDDPATLAEIEAMYKPMELLGKQQEELGHQQEELGKKQEELARQQEQATVPTPDVSKEIAEINAAVAKLQGKSGKTVTQEELADLQSKLGELQGKLGGLQGQMGGVRGEFGAKMGALGAQQGKLGAQQGGLGAEQGRLAQQADQKVKSIIDQSMQKGKAHPVD